MWKVARWVLQCKLTHGSLDSEPTQITNLWWHRRGFRAWGHTTGTSNKNISSSSEGGRNMYLNELASMGWYCGAICTGLVSKPMTTDLAWPSLGSMCDLGCRPWQPQVLPLQWAKWVKYHYDSLHVHQCRWGRSMHYMTSRNLFGEVLSGYVPTILAGCCWWCFTGGTA